MSLSNIEMIDVAQNSVADGVSADPVWCLAKLLAWSRIGIVDILSRDLYRIESP